VPACYHYLALPIYASSRSIPGMTITENMVSELTLNQALAEANSDGLFGRIKEYINGGTEPHRHHSRSSVRADP